MKRIYNIEISEQQVIHELRRDADLYKEFLLLTREARQNFLDFCRGVRGLKMTYDPFFKHFFTGSSTSGGWRR